MIQRLPQRLTVPLLALALCAMFPALSHAQSFTLQQVLSAPFPSDMKAAPHGDRFLWIADEEGR
ncbi:MAG: hypothetical protein WCC14_09160, partial [Acidobacteriaceae bacterium]